MNTPKISIITVVFNDVHHIEQTIQSVLSQTYENIEYIIIDGGSNDGTTEVIKKYSEKLAYWISERDNGIYDAMNKGISFATGKWINFMNCGDSFYDCNVLSTIFARDFPDNVKIIYGTVACKYANGNTIIRKYDRIDKDIEAFNICHQSSFTDCSLLSQIKYNTDYKICADADSFYKILKMGYAAEYVPVVVSLYEAFEGVSSKYVMKSFRERMRIQSLSPVKLNWWIDYIKSSIRASMGFIFGNRIYNIVYSFYSKHK